MTLRRSIVDDVNGWLGLHRGLGGEHRAPGARRRRNPWLPYVGLALAALVTAASLWLLASGFGQPPHGRFPQVLPQIVATQLLQSGPAATSTSGILQPSPAYSTAAAGRAPGTPAATGEAGGTPLMAPAPDDPSPTPSPTPMASTVAGAAPPPLPPPPPVTTSTPPVCPPPVPPDGKKSKGPKPSHPSHW